MKIKVLFFLLVSTTAMAQTAPMTSSSLPESQTAVSRLVQIGNTNESAVMNMICDYIGTQPDPRACMFECRHRGYRTYRADLPSGSCHCCD
ncbi:hypothetical protein [Bdellovibrio sp. NC01]|uniref:hypothetical protein n=1 Tax=Bdellovibrio sp. NC01 TaxID=2220073 RepID=UPI0011577200|nr:hypothetical protein [Bdellovibrio sp. NC01]QDK37593.1 hypothetical protein DOE51_08360 [Bdellovibrio sp. NC01]